MNCSVCGSQCKKGFIEARSHGTATRECWYPASEEDKLHKRNGIPLYWDNTAYYCERCKKAFATFDNADITNNGIV